MYEPPEHTQTEWSADNNGEYLKSNPNPVEINHNESLIESRKSDHSIYYTVPLQPLSCSECGKPFTDSIVSNLATHKKIHTGEKTFICIECGKCFFQASSLADHIRIHTGEKPFICTECGKCFTSSSNLAHHIRIHIGEKTFKCDECGKCFARASNLAKHKNIHTGEKTFKCDECGNSFTQASNLATHVRIHTREKPFKSNDINCEYRLPSKLSFILHRFLCGFSYKCYCCNLGL
uniref:C2H2-type domain-containing protein n=1 Tax=Leptobrachium leishanense TaxID=445787 RepID=A0A8C5M5J1_9ANUR